MRVKIPLKVLNPNDSSPEAEASVEIYDRDSPDTLAVIYADPDSGDTLNQPLLTDASGRVPGWIERGGYNCLITPLSIPQYPDYFDAAPASDGSIDVDWIPNSSISQDKLDFPAGVTDRESAVINTAVLNPNTTEQSAIMVAKGFRLMRVTANRNCRIRLYTSPTKRDADLNRLWGIDPVGDHGVILELVFPLTPAGNELTKQLSPQIYGDDFKANPDGYIAYNVTNLDNVAGQVVVTLDFQRTEPT